MDQNVPQIDSSPQDDNGSNIFTRIKESITSSNLRLITSLGVALVVLLAIPISVLTLRQQQDVRSSAASVKLGYDQPGSGNSYIPDQMMVAKLTVPADKAGNFSSGSIYLKGGSSYTDTYFVVYSDNNGNPGNLLGQSNVMHIEANRPVGWVSYTFPLPISVNGGQTIWIGGYADYSGSTRSTESSTPTFYWSSVKQGDFAGTSAKYTVAISPPLPSTFGQAYTASGIQSLSLYLDVTTNAATGLSSASCTPAQLNTTTSCSAIGPTSITASTVKFSIGDGLASGTCDGTTSGTSQSIVCTEVSTGTVTGTQKIYYQIGSGAKTDSGQSVQIGSSGGGGSTTITVGNTQIGTSTSNSYDRAWYMRFNVAAEKAGSATGAKAYLRGGTNSADVYIGIYRDNNDVPGVLLGKSTKVVVGAYSSRGWKNFILPSGITLQANTKYWIAYLADNPNTTSYSSTGGPALYYTAGAVGDYDNLSAFRYSPTSMLADPAPILTNDGSVRSPSIYVQTVFIPTDTPTPTPTSTPVPTAVPTTVTVPEVTSIQPTVATVAPGQASLDFSFTLPGISSNSVIGDNNSPTNKNPSSQVIVLPVVGTGDPVATINTYAPYNPATGVYSGTAPLPPLFAAGTYKVKIKTDNSLFKYVPGVNVNIVGGAATTLPQVSLNLGDINGDNRVDTIDYSAMIYCFPGQAAGAGTCAPGSVIWQRADVNQDGVVDTKDLAVLYRSLFIIQGD